MPTSNYNTKLRKIGNGRGVLLSKTICQLAGMELGGEFQVILDDDRITLIPSKDEGGM